MEAVEIDLERLPESAIAVPVAAQNAAPQAAPPTQPWRLDLLRIPWLRTVMVSRWPLFLARALALAGFIFTILAGLFGSAVGSHNFAIIFVWIAWWTALKLVFIPAGGRSWCSICPLPLPGEWLQQGGLLGRNGERRGLHLAWPKRLKGYWLQSIAFLAIGLFSAVTLTDPRVTAWVLLALFGLAIGLSLVIERRAFCSYLCPIGGFTGMYSQTAPLELRVKDIDVCKTHTEKTCYQECPWGVYPVALRNNSACGLCMECVRVCPHDNLSVNLRAFGTDLLTPQPRRGLDETFLSLVMLGSALAFAAVFTGPWGWLKSAAFAIWSPAWFAYALAFLAVVLVVLPGLYALSMRLGLQLEKRRVPLRKALGVQTPGLVSLGLFAWIAFTVSFALPKISTVISVISDPFGWGWNLFGTAGAAWNPDPAAFGMTLQAALLLAGLYLSCKVTARQNPAIRENKRAFVPWALFSTAFTFTLLWLLVG
jgi:polyferredoxin